ncbi:MAG: hypothetical protein JNK45_18640 [Myxococcales bacterium]|nr:hypothetical protein [Myxococcales bacterium]
MRAGRRRGLDRALTGTIEPGEVRGLIAALREDAAARASYDRGARAMRALERRSVAQTELDWVERRLEADGLLDAGAGDRAPGRAWSWARGWWIGASVLAAAAAVLALRPPAPGDGGDGLLAPRGAADPRAGWLALSVLCDPTGRGDVPLAEVAGGSCPGDGTLAFAVRVDARHRGAEHLVVFGIDARGDVQYYLPTPDVAAPVVARRDVWTSLDRAVRLPVNHPAGRVRVFAALLPHPASIDDVDAAAAVLATSSTRRDDETPWLDRLGPAHPLLADCGVAECLGAELEFRVEPRASQDARSPAEAAEAGQP